LLRNSHITLLAEARCLPSRQSSWSRGLVVSQSSAEPDSDSISLFGINEGVK